MHRKRDTLLTALVIFIVTSTVSQFSEVEATSTSAHTQTDKFEITFDITSNVVTTSTEFTSADTSATSDTTTTSLDTTAASVLDTVSSHDETSAKLSEATTDSITNTGQSQETTARILEATTDSATSTGKVKDETTASISEATTDSVTNTGQSQGETTARIPETTTDSVTNTGQSQGETTARIPETATDSVTNTGQSQVETTARIPETTTDSVTNTGQSQGETTARIPETATDSVTNTGQSQGETTARIPETTTDSVTNTGQSQGETTAKLSEATTDSMTNTGQSQEETTNIAATSTQPNTGTGFTKLETSATHPEATTTTKSNTGPSQEGTTAAVPSTPAQPIAISTQQGTTTTTSDTTMNLTTTVTTGQITTRSTTARTTTGQTTTLSPFQQPPNFDAAPPFKMNFTIAFVTNWTAALANSSSPGYSSFKSAVDHEINTAFAGCPGYLPFTANVVRFSNESEAASPAAAPLMNSEGLLTLQETNTSVVYAAYQTSFDSQTLLGNGEATSNHIETITEPLLQNATIVTIDGSVSVVPNSVTDTAARAKASITVLRGNPCQEIGTYICSVCYPCKNNSATDITCLATCMDENKICTVNGSSSTGCTCKKKYLPVGDGCVHENVVIGATAGVVGAVLLGLVIAVCILCCKLDKKEDYNPLDSPTRTPALTASVQTIEEPIDERTTRSGEGESLELLTFATFIDKSPTQNAESSGAAPARPPRTTGLASYEAETSSRYDDRPSNQPQHSASNYSELKDEDLPEEITSSQVFVSFVPRLDAVDSQTRFAIKRPTTTLQPSSNVKMPAQNDYYP